MSKKPITWPEFLKLKFNEMKKSDAAIQFKNVLQSKEVKAEWHKITAGSHSDYSQGKATKTKKSGKASTSKASTSKASTSKASTSKASTSKASTSKAGTSKASTSKASKTKTRKSKATPMGEEASSEAESSQSEAESSKSAAVKLSIQDILAECKMCSKCKKEIQRVLNKKGMSGGCITCSL
jgi:hypothetical protein